jgi:hypothetical protein
VALTGRDHCNVGGTISEPVSWLQIISMNRNEGSDDIVVKVGIGRE